MRHHVRRGLVTAEVALAVILVTGAGLLARTVYNLTTVDAGFDRSRLVTFSMTLSPAGYPLPSARAQMYQRLLERLRAVPGVQAATAMTGLAAQPSCQLARARTSRATGPGRKGSSRPSTTTRTSCPTISRRWASRSCKGAAFNRPMPLRRNGRRGQRNLGEHILEGTEPHRASAAAMLLRAARVPVVHGDRGGQGRQAGRGRSESRHRVLPVHRPAGDQQSATVRNAPATMNVVLRTTLPLAALSQTLEQVVREVDRTVPIVRLREMESVFAESIERPRLLAQLVGAFAGLALLLATIGTYGVLVLYGHRAPPRDRHSSGARRRSLPRAGARHEAGSYAHRHRRRHRTRRRVWHEPAHSSLLFGVQPTDATTMAAVAATIALVAATACWLPAWRASRLDPNVVLRDE